MQIAKIMVVDDTTFMRVMLKNMLETSGHEVVVEAANGEDAIQMFKQYKPDLVTMDITMPVMGGIEALMMILEYNRQAKVIMCSAVSQQKYVINAIQAGAKDFIVKPFQRERVLQAIKTALKHE